MYMVYLDGEYLYYPGDEYYHIVDPNLHLLTGYAGEFKCVVPQDNPAYEKIRNRRSMISVFRDDKEIFYGEVRSSERNLYKEKEISVEGALSFLADTIQPQAEYRNLSPRQILGKWLDIHNSQVEARKRICLGIVSVHDSNDSFYLLTNRENTLSAIREKLVGKLGGYLRLRHENEQLYLDWITLEEYGKYCSQPIKFGLNLLDYTESITTDDLITCLIPLGAKLDAEVKTDAGDFEKLPRYVDIRSVNDGLDYIYNEKAVEAFGWIRGTVRWDDVNVPINLLKKGREYLESAQFESMVLELTAADLSVLATNYDQFEPGDRILCEAEPYGMNRVFPLMELTIPLQEPDGFKISLGEKRKLTYTESVANTVRTAQEAAEDQVRVQTEWLKSSINELTARMTGSKGGYKLSEFDEKGLWLRDLYMDAPDKNLASRILQINKEGIGGSRNGYSGPYTTGMLLDGTILGERIKAGSIKTETLSTDCKTYFEKQISDAENESKQYAMKQVTSAIEAAEGRISLSVKSVEQQLTQKKGIWYGTYAPTISNEPASGWNTKELRQLHKGDLYYDTSTGYAYRYNYGVPGLAVTFDAQSETESVGYDWIQIFYERDGTMYAMPKLGGAIGAKTVRIPSHVFWLYWRTDTSKDSYWGFRVTKVEAATADWKNQDTPATLPTDAAIVSISGSSYPESSHGGYGNNVRKLWKYTGNAASGPDRASWDRVQDKDIAAADAAAKAAQKDAQTALAEISVMDGKIALTVTKGQVESLITQKADSIRLKANKIAWKSTYSSMTEAGKLTCQSANIRGKFVCSGNGYWLRLENAILDGGPTDVTGGKIDFASVVYNQDTGKNMRSLNLYGKEAISFFTSQMAIFQSYTAHNGDSPPKKETINFAISRNNRDIEFVPITFIHGWMTTHVVYS
ncbi:phage tail protein [Ruminococcus gauvreauii]|uniref:Phage tail protein n=1 Tax=Ruminococcus gauvreauii TaxID=438033 RepID=A0ABY5VIM0_9FIRM|nr:phage tail protein [Ruminococcus gauvreauii]UWP60429.1 phage tail protein [Ruminococcus gauvreauii]